MKQEERVIAYDADLKLEAYHFQGDIKPFPNHFHKYYVIGFIEGGERTLSCKNQEYLLKKGYGVVFNPYDTHACTPSGSPSFDYRGFHISKPTMLDLTEEVTGTRKLPLFSKNVIFDKNIALYMRPLHDAIIEKRDVSIKEKEEILLSLISLLLQNCGNGFQNYTPECREEIEKACKYMKQHYAEHVNLEQICRHVGLGKSTLLRAFTKEKGITPYRYLEALRINEAKKLLSRGMPPLDVAMQMGFSDQSHFTNYFNNFIGLAPGTYRETYSEKHRRNKQYDCKE